MDTIDLTKLSWQLRGWRPYAWRLPDELSWDVPAMPATIPGSVQTNLRRAGVLPDWNIGFNSLACEWVEHRHWEFFADLEVFPGDGPFVLCADGLDYSGWVLVDGREMGTFRGTLLRHRIDLTDALRGGGKHRLAIVLDSPPEEFGQVGYANQSRFFKPRYNYSWDWCPRFVPVGVWDRLSLAIGEPLAEVTHLRAMPADDLRAGEVRVTLKAGPKARSVSVTLHRAGQLVAQATQVLRAGTETLTLAVPSIELWWTNGEGAQPLYDLDVRVEDADGNTVSIRQERVGFKKIEWLPCEGAPVGATPWICQVNGRPVFLKGFNWVPASVDFHSTTEDDYRTLIDLYRDGHCNILRVWGGAILERETFYRLCDEAGLLVWQEFPLGASCVNSWPPEDPAVIAELEDIARDYIRRRGHHVCKLLWCGGNELQSDGSGSKTGIGVPVDNNHPAMAMLARVVEEEDSGVRFLPTSASGPSFMADDKKFGRGLHHDVHGPWKLPGTMAEWETYWANDDALFRSETGTQGSADLAFLEKHADGQPLFPPDKTNRFILHTSAWWVQYDRFKDRFGDVPPEEWMRRYTEASSREQADALAIAARHTMARFPKCGGFMVWMGHDAYPCMVSIAVIDFYRQPRPAFLALAEIFRHRPTLAPNHD